MMQRSRMRILGIEEGFVVKIYKVTTVSTTRISLRSGKVGRKYSSARIGSRDFAVPHLLYRICQPNLVISKLSTRNVLG